MEKLEGVVKILDSNEMKDILKNIKSDKILVNILKECKM